MPVGDPFLPVLMGLAVLLAVNRLVLPRFALRAAVFLPIVVADIGVALWAAIFGLPGVESIGAVRWIVSALLAMHVALAFSARSKARWEHDKTLLESERSIEARERRRARAEPPDTAE